jgi:TfoX/Sxy family transcriptional regulator of competence genes
MFGYPAAFVHGRMFAGLHEDRLVLRVDDQTIAAAKRRGATDFEAMAGRAMKGWVAVPRRLLHDEDVVRDWIEAAFRHVASPPAKKPRRARRSGAR